MNETESQNISHTMKEFRELDGQFTPREFGGYIKQKYSPAYDDYSEEELAYAVVEKYPDLGHYIKWNKPPIGEISLDELKA